MLLRSRKSKGDNTKNQATKDNETGGVKITSSSWSSFLLCNFKRGAFQEGFFCALVYPRGASSCLDVVNLRYGVDSVNLKVIIKKQGNQT